jgi:inosine-uridine nucleoside N-ribohydrolase
MNFYLGKQEQVFGLQVAPTHDVCALVPYVDSSLIRTVETSVKVEGTSSSSLGVRRDHGQVGLANRVMFEVSLRAPLG